MNDHDQLDDRDPHLSERMERAVGGLRSPDVGSTAISRGRRLRTRRRLAYGAGGIAASTALLLVVQGAAGDGSGPEQEADGPAVAADPAATSAVPTPTPTVTPPPPAGPGTGGSEGDPCGPATTGWWSKSAAQIRTELSALLPKDVGIGVTDDDSAGTWGGNLTTAGDADFASLALVPPPERTSPRRSDGGRADDAAPFLTPDLEETCFGGSNEPLQAVAPCDELAGHVACEEIRSDDETLVGVVTESVEQTITNGQEQPTDRTYLVATVAVPGGGHVELYVAEGTRADRPHTVHDPADVPALTMGQLREIVTDPVWTR